MQYKQNQKIIIDKRKLDILIRIGCPDEQLLQLIKTGTFEKTGDKLIDDTLECLVDIKDFNNWGGVREGAGRKKKNQVDNQDDRQLEDIDKDKDIYISLDKCLSNSKGGLKKKTEDMIKDLANNISEKNHAEIAGKTVHVAQGEFYMDNTMPDYKSLLCGLSEAEIEKLRNWIMQRYAGKHLPVSKIQLMIKNFNKNLYKGVMK